MIGPTRRMVRGLCVLLAMLAWCAGARAGDFQGYELAYSLGGENASDLFGWDIEVLAGAGGPQLVVSALRAHGGGSCYLYDIGPSSASLLSRVDGLDRMGWDIAAVGDVNGDGQSDYAVSEYYYGKVHVISGADRTVGGTWPAHPGVLLSMSLNAYNIGGLPDQRRILAISREGSGRAYVLDAATGATVACLLPDPGTYINDVGDSAGVCDLIGADGFGDLAIVTGDGSRPGRIYLVNGTTTAMNVALTSVAGITLDGQRTDDCIGRTEGRGQRCVVDIADVTGDGVRDLAVGGFKASVNGPESGSVLVYSGHDGSFVYRLDGAQPDDWFGNAVVALGDLDGDGFGDFAVGARGENNIPSHVGHAYVYSGRTGTLLQTLTDGTGCYGGALANLGDLNGDGLDDLAVANYFHDGFAGEVYIYTSVPEPAALSLLAIGAAGLFASRRRAARRRELRRVAARSHAVREQGGVENK